MKLESNLFTDHVDQSKRSSINNVFQFGLGLEKRMVEKYPETLDMETLIQQFKPL